MKPQKKLLSIDGGGIRGMIALRVLRKIETLLRQQRGQPDLVLSDYFDYIGGTSTGGIVAAALAIGMSVDQIEAFYRTEAPSLFSPVHNPIRRMLFARYESTRIAAKLQDVFGADTTMGSDRIKTLLMLVMLNASTSSPWPVSNNSAAMFNDAAFGADSNLNLPLWQLVRASTAAPYFLQTSFSKFFLMLKYLTVPVTPFQQNCSLVWCEQTLQAAVIDPGGDLPRILAEVKRLGLKLEQIWLTHAHIDHAGGTAELSRQLGLPIVGPHPGDQFWIDGLAAQGRQFGFPHAEVFTPTRWLHDGDTISIGNCTLQVRHCPGHTPGHVVFYSEEAKRAFVGDVLFAGSIGRTDFPQGDHDTLIASIKERLWPMGSDTVFIPGHGPESTFGRERRSNPYVADA